MTKTTLFDSDLTPLFEDEQMILETSKMLNKIYAIRFPKNTGVDGLPRD